MGTMEFWKCEPDKFLVGVRGLTLEECGAYTIILQLIYSTDDQLLDDDFEMCGSLRCNVRVWHRIKKTLIDKEKIYVENGYLRNSKASSTILNAVKLSAKVSELNRIKGVKSGVARNKNKDLREPPVEPSVEPQANHKKEEIRDKKEEKKEIESEKQFQAVALPQAAKPKKTASRLPDDWFPDPLSRDFLTRNPVTPETQNREFEKFRNYWQAKPGVGAIKLDWNATWRNWLLNNYSGNQNDKSQKPNSKSDAVDWLHREAERREQGNLLDTDGRDETQGLDERTTTCDFD